MITLNIEDKYIESIFLNEFHSNKEKFFEFIKNSFNNSKAIGMDDYSYLEDEIQKGIDSGISDKSHDEIWENLFQKYA